MITLLKQLYNGEIQGVKEKIRTRNSLQTSSVQPNVKMKEVKQYKNEEEIWNNTGEERVQKI